MTEDLQPKLGTKTITATFVKDLGKGTGSQKLWPLSEPVTAGYGEDNETTEYVVTSATIAMSSGPETYIFASDAEGEITNWGEMTGSFRGELDHEHAIENAGWEIEHGD